MRTTLWEVWWRPNAGSTARLRPRNPSAAIHRKRKSVSGLWAWRPTRRWRAWDMARRSHRRRLPTWRECSSANTCIRVEARWPQYDHGSTTIPCLPASCYASSKITTVCPPSSTALTDFSDNTYAYSQCVWTVGNQISINLWTVSLWWHNFDVNK